MRPWLILLALAGCHAQASTSHREVRLVDGICEAAVRIEVGTLTAKCIEDVSRPAASVKQSPGLVRECEQMARRTLCPLPAFAVFEVAGGAATQITRARPCTQADTAQACFVCAVPCEAPRLESMPP